MSAGRSIATRTGDDGTTSLLYGQRVRKDHPQIEAVGAFDELNAAIGFAKAAAPAAAQRATLELIQQDLVALMGELACAESDTARYAESTFRKIGEPELARIDAALTAAEAQPVRLDGWATPGANLPAAALDLARTAARRAERQLVGLPARGRSVRPVLLRYINRVSDLLWLMARAAAPAADPPARSLVFGRFLRHARRTMILALLMLVLAAGYRVVAAWEPSLANFAPLMALTFCAGVYFRDRRLWAAPFLALVASDIYLDHYYATQFGYNWTMAGAVVRALCFAAALLLGRLVAERKSWLNLFAGTLGGAVLFYVVTNTQSWASDPGYARTAAGWWQAMTVGHPEFAPTLLFFRNSLASDLFFTAAFVLAMEYRALRSAQPSLLSRRAAA